MSFDFKSIEPSSPDDRPVDPIEIFHSLRVKDPSVNDLWFAQGQALEEWHADRGESDIAISLNTGAGKTLVGLLLAQSLVNETDGLVLYACNSIQLVEQTCEKATGYGLDVTHYYRQEFSNSLFRQGKAPCITTYQALFNGRSRFFKEEIAAVIFDDAHTASDALRDQYSLTIGVGEFTSTFFEIFSVFKDYFHKADRGIRFDEIADRSSEWILLAPSFEVLRHKEHLLAILREANLSEYLSTKFAWEHLKDNIEQCAFFLSEGSVTITPPYIPVSQLPYFNKTPRRVYLSATLGAEDSFIRTFGKQPSKVIAPKTNAGECERLILFPRLQKSIANSDVEFTKTTVSRYKTLFLTPTYKRAEVWKDIVVPPERDKVAEAVSSFRESKGKADKLILTARYDGVDLPGDTCRMMVVDDLPSKSNILDRYLWSFLKMSKTLRSIIASKVIQSFGRISRGNSDYGVVFTTGQGLVDWLLTPDNMASLPDFLQKQIILGIQISESATSDEYPSIINSVLERKKEWLQSYEKFIKSQYTKTLSRNIELEMTIAIAEAEFSEHYWNRNYKKAAKKLMSVLAKSKELSSSTEAWHSYWIATSYLMDGDEKSANNYFRMACSAQSELPRPLLDDSSETVTIQAQNISLQFIESPKGDYMLPKGFDAALQPIISMHSTSSRYEESIRALGLYLGAKSTRPEKEFGTGPDVLWEFDGFCICIDAKTDKGEGSEYRKKDDIGQMSDHIEWVKRNIQTAEIIPAFVGPILPASKSSNPSSDLCVISKEQLNHIAQAVQASYRDLASNAMPLNLGKLITEEINSSALTSSHIKSIAQQHRLIDL